MLPLAPELYKLQVTLRRSTHEKLRRVQDLLRHTLPDGDVAAILDRALTVLLSDLERSKPGRTERPRPGREVCRRSRHIPAAVKRLVWIRDQGQCAFVGTQGRCEERAFLEFHHLQPYAAGGLTVVENLELRCRAHNLYEAERYFGDRLPLLARESAGAGSGARGDELGPDRVPLSTDTNRPSTIIACPHRAQAGSRPPQAPDGPERSEGPGRGADDGGSLRVVEGRALRGIWSSG